jgi:hypothetical protein
VKQVAITASIVSLASPNDLWEDITITGKYEYLKLPRLSVWVWVGVEGSLPSHEMQQSGVRKSFQRADASLAPLPT